MDLKKLNRIAIFRTDRLGDMVLTLPLANAIKTEIPEAEITMFARSYTSPLLIKSPVIDNIIFIDKIEKKLYKEIKQNRFDAVFFPRPRFDEALAAFLAGVKYRIGSGYRAYSFLFNHKVFDHRKSAEYNEAEYNTRLLGSILSKSVQTSLVKPFIPSDSKVTVNKILAANYFSNKDFLIIHPGSRGSALDWNAKNFGIAANIISKQTGLNAVITGIESESSSCDIAQKHCSDALNLCGKLSLTDMFALIERSKLFIANSTGTLHIAASIGIPVIGLYPNTPHISARRWGPYSQNSITISPPTDNPADIDNMNLISVERVVEAALRLLG